MEEAEKSCSMNGRELEGHILRYRTGGSRAQFGTELRVTFSGTGGSRAQLLNLRVTFSGTGGSRAQFLN